MSKIKHSTSWVLEKIKWHYHHQQKEDLIAVSLIFSRRKFLKKYCRVYFHKKEVILNTTRGHDISFYSRFSKGYGFLPQAGSVTFDARKKQIFFKKLIITKNGNRDLLMSFRCKTRSICDEISNISDFLSRYTMETVYS